MSGIEKVSEDTSKKKNLILTGYMGAGKTSVGEVLANLSGLSLLDTDELIEQKAGMTVSDIFDEQGEEAFRDMETELLRELVDCCDHNVIAVGGGLPMREENRELLRSLGTVVFLRVKRDTVLKRLKGDTTRPKLRGEDLSRKVDDMLSLRDPVYLECAHWVADTDDLTPEEIAVMIHENAGWPPDEP